jgi:hypothetical protein
MPWVGVLQLLSMPPRAGTTCAFLSWFVSVVELNRLPGKPWDEACVCGTVGVLVGIQQTL